MKICNKENNKCMTVNESDCYKYSSVLANGLVKYYVAYSTGHGKILRQEVSQLDFKETDCRLVDVK